MRKILSLTNRTNYVNLYSIEMTNDPVQPPARKEPESTRQTSAQVGWNGGLGGW